MFGSLGIQNGAIDFRPRELRQQGCQNAVNVRGNFKFDLLAFLGFRGVDVKVDDRQHLFDPEG